MRLSDSQAGSALDRLAVAEVTGTVMVNNSLYRPLWNLRSVALPGGAVRVC